MSNEALTWAFAQNVGSSGAKFVLVALADKADEMHSCWPSQATLARMTDQGERTVRRHLADLEEAGFVTRSMQRRKGVRSSDRYTLAVSVAVGVLKVSSRPSSSDLPADLAGSQAADLAGSDADQAASLAGTLPANLAEPTGQSGQVTHREPSRRTHKEEPSSGPAAPDPGAGPAAKTDRPSSVPGPDDNPSETVLALCNQLADLIEKNGSKRPKPGKAWYAACRLMIDQDGRDPAGIAKAITWCQKDEFWRANVMSMPKLREQYDRLRLAAQRSAAPTAPSHAERAKAALNRRF